jgi:hypothetical protein
MAAWSKMRRAIGAFASLNSSEWSRAGYITRGYPERDVAAEVPSSSSPPRTGAPHGRVEDLSLLVTNVHHDALFVVELIDTRMTSSMSPARAWATT